MTEQDFLLQYGWNEDKETVFTGMYGDSLVPARVTSAVKGHYFVAAAGGTGLGRITGAFEYTCAVPGDYPVVGDWVAVEAVENTTSPFVIHGVLPRTNSLSRKAAGDTSVEQVLAANIDTVFIVFSLEGGRKCSPRAAKRYVTMVWESGAQPVILLNKLDLCDDSESIKIEIEKAAPGVDVLPVSCISSAGIELLSKRILPGKTFALIGPSGTGKSTIINILAGEERQETGEVREGDKKGRHTTTRRELILLPRGALLLDTPGLRELQLWGAADSLDDSFSDIAGLAEECRFRDCQHTGEPGCAVLKALEEGVLDEKRYENYLDLRRELNYLKSRTEEHVERKRSDQRKQISKQIRRYYKEK